jgi:hypothetical protein
MNYFAHGRHYVDRPYLLAGTAVPDWLSVVDRKVRARAKHASKFLDAPDSRIAAVARGIVQHHHDDDWFHQTRAFAELSLNFAVTIRQLLPADDGFRPSFLGHILVEILLDAELIDEAPQRLDAYYRALEQVDPEVVGRAVNLMSTRQTDRLSIFIHRFSAERFLYDYAADETLLLRLNNIMQRVKLPKLPSTLCQLLPAFRRQVQQRKAELLSGDSSATVGN